MPRRVGTTSYPVVNRVPRLRLLPEAEEADHLPLGAGDVLLVTGGGKGIAAECAPSPQIAHLLAFIGSSKRGIARGE